MKVHIAKNKSKKNSYASGVCEITDTLSIAKDCSGQDMENPAERIIVVTHYPHPKENHEHWHIQLDYKGAVRLMEFLENYINEVYTYHE